MSIYTRPPQNLCEGHPQSLQLLLPGRSALKQLIPPNREHTNHRRPTKNGCGQQNLSVDSSQGYSQLCRTSLDVLEAPLEPLVYPWEPHKTSTFQKEPHGTLGSISQDYLWNLSKVKELWNKSWKELHGTPWNFGTNSMEAHGVLWNFWNIPWHSQVKKYMINSLIVLRVSISKTYKLWSGLTETAEPGGSILG